MFCQTCKLKHPTVFILYICISNYFRISAPSHEPLYHTHHPRIRFRGDYRAKTLQLVSWPTESRSVITFSYPHEN